MAPHGQIRLQKLQQAGQCSLILMQHFDGMAAIPQTIIFVGQQGRNFLHDRARIGDRNQPVSLLQFGADIFSVEGMRPH